jgi:aldose 1-epimerase
MNISREVVGRTRGHSRQEPRTVDSYTLDNQRGLAVTVWTYGATVVEVRVPDRDGAAANVVVRLPDLDGYQDRARNPYLGATVGRFCRSVAGGGFTLDRVAHRLDRNDGRHQVHGGTFGFDRLVWDAEADRDGDRLRLHLTLASPDGDQGYPGDLLAEADYIVDAEGRLTIEYSATTSAPTVVGLTNHAFWNLAGSGTIDGHLLAVNADRALVFDEELIPVPGPPAAVTGTELDFSSPRRIGGDRLDNCFVLDDPGWTAELSDPHSGRTLLLTTDQPGIGVYSGDFFTSRPRSGLCLETGALPDAPNRPDFPTARLDPGDRYRHRTVYAFSVRPPAGGAQEQDTDEVTRAVLDLVSSLTATRVTDVDAPLAPLGLGSLQLVGLVVDLESLFSVEIPVDAMRPETFHSAETIARTVRSLRTAAFR